MSRVAVVLFNLGGPDTPDAVQPFLFNLFNDKAIIGVPQPMRWFLARMISRRRAPIAREIYSELGGGSPLLPNTKAQAVALEQAVNGTSPDDDCRVFVAMRYWHPFASETAREVAAFHPDRVVLLPLYPQYSTTTSQSSLDDWAKAARKAGITAPTQAVCCYPAEDGFVAAVASEVRAALDATPGARLLFSAHGLPKKIIERGDPYQWQVEASARAVTDALEIPDLDWAVCYQSRVGPLEWIGPSTEEEIARAGRDGVSLVIAPIAFVSEHSETLVELDVEYRELAATAGVPEFSRVPTVSTRSEFIAGLAALVAQALGRDDAPGRGDSKDAGKNIGPDGGARVCPAEWGRCPCAEQAAA